MPRIAVIVPAYNAESTIQETLLSACRQTFRDLAIVVVSDGSDDATPDLVRNAMEADPRIRLLEQENSGVAAARNRAIDATDCEFIAPLDADDIWHPDKLALQMARFENSDTRTGLVYNWCRLIDDRSRWCGEFATPMIEGKVLHRLLRWNFIGNGSTPLIRREALAGLRYDSSLRAENAGGCEDYLLQLQISREWQYSCVPSRLTGYRASAATMSGDKGAMLRSHIAMYRRLRAELDGAARKICDERIAHYLILLASHRFGRNEKAALRPLVEAWRIDATAAAAAMAHQARTLVASSMSRAQRQTRSSAFDALDPSLPASVWEAPGWMRRYAALDRQAEN